jgi:hypothetical protein
MVRRDRGSMAEAAPLDDLLTLLLRQFKRPLMAQGVPLSDGDAQAIARAIVNREPLPDPAPAVRAALSQVVQESEQVLARWGFRFEQAMETGMEQMPGWNTTAEFLEIANEKSNAELRIAAGASLLLALGDRQVTPYVLYLASRQDDDLDFVVARRVLQFVSGVDPSRLDWLERVRAWAEDLPATD